MLGTTLDFLLVLLGFGAIIFVHELGHFLAARWAGIRVLAFAVGFGPALVSFRKGLGMRAGSSEAEVERLRSRGVATGVSPTEYRLNVLPFGGYVKMLGQEDGNPEAVSDAPDSFQACKPWKRLVVISAGVVMNIVTAAALFVLVFMLGMKVEPARIGDVEPGSPAARAIPINGLEVGVSSPGLLPGDGVTAINGHAPNSFSDLVLATAMAERGAAIQLTVARRGVSEPIQFVVTPETGRESGMLEIGVEPARSAAVVSAPNAEQRESMRTAFRSLGLEGLEPGMRLASVDGRDVSDGTELFTHVRHSGGRVVAATFTDGTSTVTRVLQPRAQLEVDHLVRANKAVTPIEHLLGLMPVMTVGQTTERSEQQGLRPGDIFARLGSVEFPSIAEGMAEIQAHKGRTLAVTVLRQADSGDLKPVELPAVEVNSKGQIGFGVGDTSRDSTLVATPLPSLKRPGSEERFAPAAAGVFRTPGARIISINDRAVASFADIRTALREATDPAATEAATVSVRLRRPDGGVPGPDGPEETIAWKIPASDIRSVHALGWQSPVSPSLFEPEQVLLKASSPAAALSMGFAETRRVMLTTYVTFLRLFQGTVKVEHLKGPVGIAHLGTLVAGKGLIWLLFFLALISVNLAVVNFLPLPIVDGGQFLFILYEQLSGRPVPMAVQSIATLAGLVLIGCVFLTVTYNDIRQLLGL
jgi:regulator of sigma E protease